MYIYIYGFYSITMDDGTPIFRKPSFFVRPVFPTWRNLQRNDAARPGFSANRKLRKVEKPAIYPMVMSGVDKHPN